MAVTSIGDFPLRSAWLGRGRGRGRGAMPRRLVNVASADSANNSVWSDFFFEASGPTNVTVFPGLIGSGGAFYSATVSTSGGSQSLTASLFANGQTFYAPTRTSTLALTASLFTGSQTFYAPTATSSRNLSPSLVPSGGTFYASGVSTVRALSANRLDNAQTFYGPAASNLNTVAPPMFADSEFVFPPTIETVGPAQTLSPTTYVNGGGFFSASAANSETPSAVSGGGSLVRPSRKFRPSILWEWEKKAKQEPEYGASALILPAFAVSSVSSVSAMGEIEGLAYIEVADARSESFMLSARSSWNDPTDEELIALLAVAF